MTDETKHKVKKALFARMREKAVACLHAMGADALLGRARRSRKRRI